MTSKLHQKLINITLNLNVTKALRANYSKSFRFLTNKNYPTTQLIKQSKQQKSSITFSEGINIVKEDGVVQFFIFGVINSIQEDIWTSTTQHPILVRKKSINISRFLCSLSRFDLSDKSGNIFGSRCVLLK